MLMLCVLAFLSPPVECEPEDHECNAKQFERMAAETREPQRRADQFYGAHRAYLARYDQSGKARHLCAARRAFDRGVGIKGQTSGQRLAFAALRDALEEREQKSGVKCTKEKRQKEIPPTEVAPSAVPVEASPLTRAEPTVSHLETETPVGAPLAARPAEPAEAHQNKAVTPASQPAPRAVSDARRRRVKAGLGTLLPGLVLLAPMAGLQAFRGGVRAEWEALRAGTIGRSPTADEESMAWGLNRQFRGATAGVAVLGATSAALVITGTILLATGRSTRVALGPWGARGLIGLAIQGRF